MVTVELCLSKYEECKRAHGRLPEYREYLSFSGIEKRQFSRLFGREPFTKLQEAAGDKPNKLQLERVPLDQIMRQYGELVIEIGNLPVYAEWHQRGLQPTESGLRNKPHQIKWSELPSMFLSWIETSEITGFDKAVEIISKSHTFPVRVETRSNRDFEDLVLNVRDWIPARRRNSEAEYKIELRKHLESLSYELNEEFGESRFDLLVRKSFVIEIKKDPDLAEYDRLFGQVARHLQFHRSVIVLVIEATRGDKYDQFATLVDKFLNVNQNAVELIKK